MTKSILTNKQQSFLKFFNSQPELYKRFYFSGGTALSEYYLQHRFSEDLDFFSEKEITFADLNLFLTAHKSDFGATQIQHNQSFNRNLFFMRFADNTELKTEFTYYPFSRLEQGLQKDNLQIDSVLDIAVNKAFTLTQQARGRDYFDLYAIWQKYGFDFSDLLKKARQKFDYPINYLELGKNLYKVTTFLDDPILLENIDRNNIEKYFLELAKKIELLD
ncbi:MAG: nucleotidyl transferase AbiEii/AbiGii toxin family protein [Candidatus Margulisbacteria bacterium]|jgi:predicted nucleotidyltransferase component of viral defense system|nr:nucleotidyl transferase AbiEii/AbiGii toxin family protein [Candidatus Margulisiibacteriota bacterium]